MTERIGECARGVSSGIRSSIVFALVAILGACLTPASASALAEHPFFETFGNAMEPSFTSPEGLAIDQSNGDLLVIDAGAGTLSRFNPDGTPAEFEALGTNVIDGSETPQGSLSFGGPAEVEVAVDNSGGATDGDIYLTQSSHGLIDIFGKDGSFLGQLSASSEGGFGEACGVSVDPVGNVYVSEYGEPEGHIHKYDPSGSFAVNGDNTLNFTAATPCTLAAGAGPTAGSVFVASFEGEVRKFDGPSGAKEYEVAASPNTTVTVDPASGHVYTAAGHPLSDPGRAVNEYDASGATEATLLSSIIPSHAIWGIAVDGASGDVYVAESGNPHIEVWGPAVALPEAITEAATEVGATSAALHGTVSTAGGPEASCEFQYTTEEVFEEKGFEDAIGHACSPPGPFTGNGSEAVSAKVQNLSSGTNYVFQVVASNEHGSTPGGVLTFLTLGPSVSAGTASSITAAGARIDGEVNPRGKETSFEVQYVTEAQFAESKFDEAQAAPVPPQQLGSGSEFLKVGQQLGGLAPGTSYRFRLVATNPDATSVGLEGAFTTFVIAPGALPDGRVYEMVSPTQKAGGEVFPPYPVKNLDGSCLNCLPGINAQLMPMQSAPDGEAVAYEGQPFEGGLAAGPNEYLSRRSPSGWAAQSLSSPLFANGRVGGQGYEAFSADLSRAVVFQISPALSPEAPTRNGESFANLYMRDEAGNLEPLVSEEPPNRAPNTAGNSFEVLYAGANAGTGSESQGAFDHILLEANDALTGATADAPAAVDGGVVEEEGRPVNLNVYEWAQGQLRLVNVAPNDTTEPGAVIGSGRLLAQFPGREAVDVDHAISNDGSKIFWSEEGSGQLYVRIDGEETREVKDPGIFLTASANGSKALLSDGCLYSLQAEKCEEDLSGGKGGFKGILGAAEDLSRIYFVDTATLTGENAEHKSPNEHEEGEDNLYAWNEGATTFIGALKEGDNKIGSGEVGDWKAAPTARTAQVSTNGRYLAFMSEASLTGYDNVQREGSNCGSGSLVCQEVFEYDGDNGSLHCVSCNPSRQQPLGASNLSLIQSPHLPPFQQPGNLSAAGEGRLFFESQDALTGADTNGHIQDVYEWEPGGVGSCGEAGGCISLISSGNSPNDSMFVDSTPSGLDAFFITRQQLLLRDKDDLLDLYDARAPHAPGEAVGIPEGEIAPCGGEACAGPISIPALPQDPESAEVGGPGNPPRHHKRKHHRKKHKNHRQHHTPGGHK